MHRTPLVLILLSSLACGSTGGSPTNPTPSTTELASRAPVITSMTVSPGFAVAQLTTVSYAASATDADGDSLTYVWDFADGTSATGAAVVHTYGNVFGLRSARLTVSDGRGGTASDTRAVTVGNLSGLWQGDVFTSSLARPEWTITLFLSGC
jgi:cytochrome c